MSSRLPVALASVFFPLFVGACGGDHAFTDASVDARVDGAGDGGVTIVAPPEAVVAPSLLPCPTGWREVSDAAGQASCDPWPATGAVDCPTGEAHFPGAPGCTTVGAACPAGAFAPGMPVGTVFVDATASAGGDGTEGAPFVTIADARTVLPATGGVVALARGAYDEEVLVESGELTIVGACTGETSLTRTAGDAPRAIVSARGGQLTMRNVRIFGAEIGVASMVDATSLLILEGVQIDDTKVSAALAFDGGRLVMRDSAVRDTTRGTGTSESGRAFQVLDAAEIVLERVVIERVRDLAFYVARASTSITDVAIRGVAPSASGDKGRALEVLGGATVTLSRVVIEDVYDVALLVGQEGTSLTAEDLLVRRVGPSMPTESGRGLEVIDGAHAEVTRAVFDECSQTAVFLSGAGTTVGLTDVVVARTRPNADGTSGRGCEMTGAVAATFDRVVFDSNLDVAVLVNEGASLDARDLTVTRTGSEMATGQYGSGMAVQFGSNATLTRVLVTENRSHGIFVDGEGTRVSGSDITVRDTRAWEVSGVGGVGIGVQNGASLTLTRSLLERNREVGVLGHHNGTTITLTDATVRDTLNSECFESGACEVRSAGLATISGAHLGAERFLVSGGAFAGVQLAVGGEMDLSRGEVRGHLIGAAVGTGGFDVARISDEVAYYDNETNLDATELPVPGVGDPILGSGT
ncbi:MAG: right-handed parallel beta-helix repeat-containing protein [Deltaproteobacteria bacterium]|nr:right-handed parallel beta-helix repeat-containing protein [Deltaproteobacteria bacterium]